ncbi:MAG: SurA N-terminal domain-containing protein [Burkholderiaceae bacterium]
MFDFVRRNTRALQFVLLLFIVPAFVLTGVYQGYNAFVRSGDTAARVGDIKISQQELEQAHRREIERVRASQPTLDPRVIESLLSKQRTLDALVRERVLELASRKLGLQMSDERLRDVMARDPQLASLRTPTGQIDRERYLQALAAAGISPVEFEASYARNQVLSGLANSVPVSNTATGAAFDAFFQQREIQVQRFEAKDFMAKVDPSAAEIEAFYKDPAHAAAFQSPEQADIEYVVLDIENLKKDIAVPEAELRAYYDANVKRFSTPAERRASHILVKSEKTAAPAEREKAKAKAESLLAQVKKNPALFADLARTNSDDPGSAEKGGELDFFGRDAMTKPFEDAAFALKTGEIGPVVESDFGYHVIQVTGARGGETKGFDAVKAEIEDEIKRPIAQKRYSEAALEFTNMVYEQPDSLKPAADKWKLELRSVQGVRRTPAVDVKGPLANAKFLDAIFGNDALRNKRNTEAVETGANQLASARVVRYSPAHQLPLAQVTPKVRELLVAQRSAALARKAGEERLAVLKATPSTALAEPALIVSRTQPRDLPREILDAALKAPAAALPSAVGVDLGSAGYAVVRVTKLLGRDPAAADPARAQAQYAQAWGDAEAQAYLASLKASSKVEVTPQPAATPIDPAASASIAAAR